MLNLASSPCCIVAKGLVTNRYLPCAGWSPAAASCMATRQERDVFTNGDGSPAPRRAKHSCQSTRHFGPHFPLMEKYEAAMRRGSTGRNFSGRRRRTRTCRPAPRDSRTMKHLRQGVMVPYGGGWLIQPRQGADRQPCDSTSVDPALLHAAMAHLNVQCSPALALGPIRDVHGGLKQIRHFFNRTAVALPGIHQRNR
jgi:hypothetical protein